MQIWYTVGEKIALEQFEDLLHRSGLAPRRPVDDSECLAGMLAHADLLATAWDGELLVGVARSVTDFHYACYLSDIAVDQAYQRQGIGRQLMQLTQQQCRSTCKLIVLSAPDANDYYPAAGFVAHPRAWIRRSQ